MYFGFYSLLLFLFLNGKGSGTPRSLALSLLILWFLTFKRDVDFDQSVLALFGLILLDICQKKK